MFVSHVGVIKDFKLDFVVMSWETNYIGVEYQSRVWISGFESHVNVVVRSWVGVMIVSRIEVV